MIAPESNTSPNKTFTITTAIDYVNAAPHIGHAYEKIATDVITRYQRLRGREAYFLTGTDEHGTKVQKTAAEHGIPPKAYTDQISAEFKKTWQFLNLDYDRFIRTTDAEHYTVVEALWRKMVAKGDIYKARYTGLYCSGCENFVLARDLTEDGLCPHHQRKPDPVEEENYFFKLTRYKEAVIQLIQSRLESGNDFILPRYRAQEVLHLLEEVEDISVSRARDSVSWGIPVPDDSEQVIYVWIDALSNYLTGCGYLQDDKLFARCWPADVHMIGKDILRFHAIYWPAMLMSVELPLPGCVFAHGFINLNDAKISKSIGNVVSPLSLAERFELSSPDPIRYYLMTVTHFGQDGNFTEDDFKTRINADLANNLGNLLNRTLNMTMKYLDGKVPVPRRVQRPADFPSFETVLGEIESAYDHFAFTTAAEKTLHWADGANKLINDSEPWNLHKNGDHDQLQRVLYTVLDTLRQVAIMLSPLTPSLCQAIWEQLGYKQPLSEFTWDDILKTTLPEGQTVDLQGPILPRLESELVGSNKKK